MVALVQLRRTLTAGGLSYSSCVIDCSSVLETVRGERREGSRTKPARGFGRGMTTSSSRPPSVTPIASGLGNGFTSFEAFLDRKRRGKDAPVERSGHGPRGQDSTPPGCPRAIRRRTESVGHRARAVMATPPMAFVGAQIPPLAPRVCTVDGFCELSRQNPSGVGGGVRNGGICIVGVRGGAWRVRVGADAGRGYPLA